jgi:hypothetical protein
VVGIALSKGPSCVDIFPPHTLRTETDPVSETSCFLDSRLSDDGKVQKLSNSERRHLLVRLYLFSVMHITEQN